MTKTVSKQFSRNRNIDLKPIAKSISARLVHFQVLPGKYDGNLISVFHFFIFLLQARRYVFAVGGVRHGTAKLREHYKNRVSRISGLSQEGEKWPAIDAFENGVRVCFR